MPFPVTHHALVESGYQLVSFAQCSGCERDIEWWKTPENKFIPMDPMGNNDAPAVSHWATCPKAAQFRRKK